MKMKIQANKIHCSYRKPWVDQLKQISEKHSNANSGI